MKAVYFFITLLSMLAITSCASSENELFSESTTLELMKNSYGLEPVSYAISDAKKVPSVSLADIQSVLEALRLNSNKQTKCTVESVNDAYFGDKNEVNRKVVMGSQYTATTRTGVLLENFLLRVELKFNIDNKLSVYYYGTDYLFDSNLFDWRANGLSLAPAKNADEYTYEFESESFLYFKVKEEGDALLRVGIVFKGNYNFKTEKGFYSFQLEKYSK